MNIVLARQMVQHLATQGVGEYVICAGARNAPFVKVLGAAQGVVINYFYDERAAGFFALGRARRSERPVAVITTSGTAAAELLPAVIEAHYSGVPLLLITADRPQHFRGCGSPQTIEQVGIFSHFVAQNYDVATVEQVLSVRVDAQGPVHANVCFAEPLIDAEVTPLQIVVGEKPAVALPAARGFVGHAEILAKEVLRKMERPLILLGAISADQRSAIFEVLKIWRAPIYAEAQSGLREAVELEPYILRAGAHFLTTGNFVKHFDSVIRIGSVPTLRLWRDLEQQLEQVPVLSVSELPLSGLARAKDCVISFADFLKLDLSRTFENKSELHKADREAAAHLESGFKLFPQSEPAWLRVISEAIAPQSLVMLGNSLPIREWDLAAVTKDKKLKVLANRGANGIDGLISTFFGLVQPDQENWLILGDLSALYDLNALSMRHVLPSTARVRIVVINNQGGQIFKPMFNDANFINAHNFEFSQWAEMFNVKYLKMTKTTHRKRFKQLTEELTVIEVQPDGQQTDDFGSRKCQLA